MTDVIDQLSDIGARWARLASTLCAPPYLVSMTAGLDTLFTDPVLDLAEICQQILARSNLMESEMAARDESTFRSAPSPGQAPGAPFLAMPGLRSSAGTVARAAAPRTTARSAEFNKDAHRALIAVTLPPNQAAQHPMNIFASQVTPLSEQDWQAWQTENRSGIESAPAGLRESEPASTHLADRRVGRPSNQPASHRIPKSEPNSVTSWDLQATQFEPPASVRMVHDSMGISAVLQANLASAPFVSAPIPADEFVVPASERPVSEFDPEVDSVPSPGGGLDWERFVERLTEQLEFEFLRTYGTSGG
jgi:hypothetical protein